MRRLALSSLATLLAACSAACTTLGGATPPRPALPQQVRADPSHFVVVTVSNEARPLPTRPGATPRGYDAANPYGVTIGASTAVRALEHDYGLTQVSAWPITTLGVHCIVFRVPPASTPDGVIAQLRHDPRVESAQALNQFATEAQEPAPPSHNAALQVQSSLRSLAVLEAHRWSRGAGVRIAVIDTGMDFEHPDLRDRVIERRNFVDTDEARFKLDRHGTEIGGVIAALADDNVGIVGVAPEAHLLALKACWQVVGDAARAVCNSFTLAQALEAAILERVDIVNLSLAGPPDALLTRLIHTGIQRGILFVGAVAPQGAGGEFPAAVDGVLAAQSAEDGAADTRYLLAPGHDVLTLLPGGGWDFASGSSLAAAEVSGTLALLLAERPRLRAPEAHGILVRTSSHTPGASGRPLTSINACAALAEVLRQSCAVDTGEVASPRQPQTDAARERLLQAVPPTVKPSTRSVG